MVVVITLVVVGVLETLMNTGVLVGMLGGFRGRGDISTVMTSQSRLAGVSRLGRLSRL